jgi:DedD protein
VSTPFQNRLVGVVILVAAVIIFLPSIIDGKKEKYQDEFIAIPIRPEVRPHSDEKPAINKSQKIVEAEIQLSEEKNADKEGVVIDEWRVEALSDTVTIKSVSKTASTTKPKVAVKPTIKKDAKPIKMSPPKKEAFPSEAWTIQLGAFKSAAGINTLLKKLKKSGYRVHTIPKNVIDGNITRVFVGPDVSKKKLQKQLAKLKKLTKLNGKLVPFDAVHP